MGTNSDSLASRIKQYTGKHPNCKKQDLYDEFPDAKQDTIDRTLRRQNQPISKQSKSKKKDTGTSNGQSGSNSTITPTNLSKIDEVAVEQYLCALYDISDPKENIARLIVNWIDRKGAIKQEQSVKNEFEENDFMETVKRAKSYIPNIEKEVS